MNNEQGMLKVEATSSFVIPCSLFDIPKRYTALLHAIKNRSVVIEKPQLWGFHSLREHAGMAALMLLLNVFLFSLDRWFLFVRAETGVSNCSNASK
jgi:hypothetical protein